MTELTDLLKDVCVCDGDEKKASKENPLCLYCDARLQIEAQARTIQLLSSRATPLKKQLSERLFRLANTVIFDRKTFGTARELMREAATLLCNDVPRSEDGERARMEAFYMARHVPCGWGRDRRGEYHAQFARDAWAAWQEARK